MSESDDTDLLLLIPPDFFVIHSDSEDSPQNFERSSSDHRFKRLISQVNELEERVNFIESKDSIHSESFSEANRVDQSIDYSLSYDTSNYHNVQSRDLALRFYSLASAGFRLGCRHEDTTLQYLEPCIVSSSGNKVMYPHQTFSPMSDSKSENSVNHVSCLNSSANACAISVDPVNHRFVDSNIVVDYNTDSNTLRGMSADEVHGPYKFFHHSQPFNFTFLNEIDEFLENKNKHVGKSLCNGDSFDNEVQGKTKTNESKFDGECANSEGEHKPVINLSPTDVVSCDNTFITVDQIDKLIQRDSETNFKQQTSDTNFHGVPCTDESDELLNMEKYKQDFSDRQNEKEDYFVKEHSDSEYVSLLKQSNSLKFGTNSVHQPSYAKFPKESGVSECMNKQPIAVTTNECSLPGQSSFTAGSHSANDNWESESRRRSTTLYCGVEDNAYISVIKNYDNLGGENDLVQFENQSETSCNRDSKSISAFSLPSYRNSVPSTESFIHNRRINLPLSAKELYQSRHFVHVEDGTSQLKRDKDTLLQDLQSCNSDITSNLKASKDKLKNSKVSECKSDADSKLPSCTLNSDEDVTKYTGRMIDSMKRETGEYSLQSDLPKGCLFASDYQSGVAPSKHPKSQVMNESIFNQDERNHTSHKSMDGFGKTTGPVFTDDGYYSSVGTGSSAVNVLSLSNLWGREAKELQEREMMTVEQKLEEEHCRRKHCENVIQKLQCTILELQQKLAVAVKVDQSKDRTIQQLQNAWKRLINHWQELEEQRHTISVKYSEEKEKHQQNLGTVMQKVKQCELELSKALDLAKGYKEKNEIIEQKMKEQENSYAEEKWIFQTSLQESQKHFKEAEKKLEDIQREMAEIKHKLETAENKACAEQESAIKSQEEMKNVQHMMKNLGAETTIVKEENKSLRLRLKEERARNDVADQQIKSLKLALDESRKNEKILQGELKERANILEKTKTDLRDYYQHQVELVVQEKLMEFQTQLDAAEVSLHQEMEQKEKLALEAASKQIKHITEKNLLEVNLLEEKHREELHLCKLQITQATQQINQLQTQLQSYSNRKVEIVEKLHTVMETQWQEAVRIISGSSPLVQHFEDQQHIVLEKDVSDSVPDRDLKPNNGNCNAVPPLLVPHSSSSSTTDEIPFNKEDQLTFRANNEQQHSHETDIHSKNDIKKYIEMLLNRSPGNPLHHETSCEKNSIMETFLSEGNSFQKWGKIMENQQILCNTGTIFPCSSEDNKCLHAFSNNKPIKPGKPPWK